MSALKVLDLAQQQGLLDEQAAGELRTQVAMSPRPMTAEDVVQALLNDGHLTQFQAKKLLSSAATVGPQTGEDLLEPAPAASAPMDDDDDDVVMLEAVEPATPPVPSIPRPSPPAPSTPKEAKEPRSTTAAPRSAPVIPPPPPPPTNRSNVPAASARKAPNRPAAPGVTAPMDLADPSTELQPLAPLQPLTPLQPVTPLRPIGGMKPLEPLQPRNELKPVEGLQPLGMLEPIETLEPIGPAPQLTPLGGGNDLFADPLMGAAGLTALDPLGTQAPPQPAGGARSPKVKRNQWDSPLLLIGGGLLGVIALVFALLYFSLTRGSAAEMFAQADAEYNQGEYPNAIAGYETFLKRYPEDPNASLARVRRGMAQIRAVSDGAKDPSAGLKRAQEVLPQIENEPSFNDARPELAQVLPGIADGFAQQAQDAQDSQRREQLVKATEEAMALVTNPAYIPTSLRKDVDGRINTIIDKLKTARRSIDQDQELRTALAKIDSAAKAGQIAEGYQIRKTLLQAYPTLAAHPNLTTATLVIAERERELVEVTSPKTPATTDDPKPAGFRVVLSDRSGEAASQAVGQRAFPLFEGAVYATDLKEGRVAWRRFVGLETINQPVAVSTQADADVLVTDSRTNSLLKLQGSSGKLIWRQELGEQFFPPVVAGETVVASTASGRLLLLKLGNGEIEQQAQLPQRLTVGPCFDAKSSRLYQLGEHSTIFVFNASTLQCVETYYLGHTPGAMLAPPVIVLDHLLVPQSPSDDYSLLNVLKADSESGRLSEAAKAFRLKGRITSPLSTSGKRAVVVTDLGQISVFEFDAAAEKQSVRELARIAASDSERVQYSHIVDGSRLWVAGKRCSLYDIQGSLQKLSRVWSLHQDDQFIGPLRLFGESLLHVRRRPNTPGLLVEACNAGNGEGQWRSSVATPIVAAASSEAKVLIAVTSAGQVFEVPREALTAGTMDAPTARPPMGTGNWDLRDRTQLGADRWLCSNFSAGPQALVYDASAAKDRVRWLNIASVSQAAAAPAYYHGGVLTPLESGRVLLISPEDGREQTLPFQPTLEAGVVLPWTQATALPPDGAAAAISDGLSRLFRIEVKGEPQPHLAQVQEVRIQSPLQSPLAATSDSLYGVVSSPNGYVLTSFRLADLSAGATWPIIGPCALGPVAVDGKVYAADDDSLYCLGPEQQLLWKQPLKHGQVALAPLVADGDLILVHRNGSIARLAADTGEEIAASDVGEPLGPSASIMGQRLLVGGADGVLHLVNLPRRP